MSLAVAVAELLRRVAMARFGRRTVARLHGQAWIDFLNRGGTAAGRAGPAAPVFAGTVALAVAQGPYAPDVSAPAQELLDAARRWLRRNA